MNCFVYHLKKTTQDAKLKPQWKTYQKTDSASVLPPSWSDVIIHLGDYNYCSVSTCYTCVWQIEQLWPSKWIITWSELSGNKDVKMLAESVYRTETSSVVFVLLKSDYALQINSSNIQWRRNTLYIVTKLLHKKSNCALRKVFALC